MTFHTWLAKVYPPWFTVESVHKLCGGPEGFEIGVMDEELEA